MQLSIIIATKNQQGVLLETLNKNTEAIAGYNDVELIIVNDGEDFELPSDLLSKIHFIKNHHSGVSAARNLGAKLAKGSFLLFLDDDMWINQHSFIKTREFINATDFSKAAYTINWSYPEYLVEYYKKKKLGRYVLKNNYHTLEGRARITFSSDFNLETTCIGSGSFLIAKNTFISINGYNEKFTFQGEDSEISQRLIDNGIQLYITNFTKLEHNQIHRLSIYNYLDRLSRGYKAQVGSSGLKEKNIDDFIQKKNKLAYYKASLPFEKVFLILFLIIPNRTFFDFLAFKLINILSSIQLVKSLKRI